MVNAVHSHLKEAEGHEDGEENQGYVEHQHVLKVARSCQSSKDKYSVLNFETQFNI